MNSVTVKSRFIHTPARKLRLVADAVRGQSLQTALDTLSIVPLKAARTLRQALVSAQAAAASQNIGANPVIINLMVDEGPAMKRRMLAGRGRSTRFEHRMSHILVTVADKPIQPASLPAKSRKESHGP